MIVNDEISDWDIGRLIEEIINDGTICPQCYSLSIVFDKRKKMLNCEVCGLVLREPYSYVSGRLVKTGEELYGKDK